jgi:hypothetical protein
VVMGAGRELTGSPLYRFGGEGGQSANDAREVFCKKIKGGTAVDQSSSKEHDSKFAPKVRFALDTLPSCNYQQR